MPVVQMRLRRERVHSIGGAEFRLERVAVLIRVIVPGQTAVLRDVVFDTGAPFSLFPQSVWEAFQPCIRWLSPPKDQLLPAWLESFAGATGGLCRCRLGIVSVELYDMAGGRLGPFDLAAMFALDGGMMQDVLLGLSGGMLTGRIFEMDYDAQTITLKDA